MSQLTIALLQMAAHGTDQDANRTKGDRFCRIAGQLGADIALFPEMWNIGYSDYAPGVWETDFDPHDPAHAAARAAWQARSIDATSAYVTHFRDLARELEMAIAITYLEAWPGAPRNTVSLIDRHGEIVLTYAKVHTCDFGMEEACTPGEDFYVCALDTVHGPVQVGAMICYDREFPESARILMLKGAEIILTPNACTLEQHRIEQFRTRAYENMVGVAMTNYAAPQHNGHSVAFDGIAFGDTSRDTLVVGAGESEGVYLAPFDLDALREYRAREIWGNAFRRPLVYHALTAPDVQPPFVRDRARR
jgi:N-carbamoylputrescine amidase